MKRKFKSIENKQYFLDHFVETEFKKIIELGFKNKIDFVSKVYDLFYGPFDKSQYPSKKIDNSDPFIAKKLNVDLSLVIEVTLKFDKIMFKLINEKSKC